MKILKTETEVTSTTSTREINITFQEEDREYTAIFNRTSEFRSNLIGTEQSTIIVNQIDIPALKDEEEQQLWDIADGYSGFDNRPTNLLKIIADIDWSLLRSQKLKFCEILAENDLPKSQADAIDGILSLIDVISDAVVSDGLESEETVFKSDAAGESAKLIPGRRYNVVSLRPDDSFKDHLLRGELKYLTYDDTSNLDFFHNERKHRIGILFGAVYEFADLKNPTHDQEAI